VYGFKKKGNRMIVARQAPAVQEQRVRLSDVPWDVYVAFCDGLSERYIRMTYDRGELEIMSVSAKHEINKSRLRRLVYALTEELAIDIASGASMTCRNEEMLRALEPDECFWIANESAVRNRDDIDLDIDPPPDLSLEIEISRSALDRMGIYGALKVPEVWRWDGETLSVHLLGARSAYRASKQSKAFPFLPLDEFASFLTRTDLSETKLIRAFRAWVQEKSSRWKIA
jgi:Uma2 family endonuclease